MADYHVENGRRGGLKGGATTLARYGQEHFSELGRRGGRPTWQETLEKDKRLRQEANNRAKRRKQGEP